MWQTNLLQTQVDPTCLNRINAIDVTRCWLIRLDFLGWSESISKNDCTCYGLFLAISEQFYCVPNFRYCSPNMPFQTVLMGTLVHWKNLKKLKEIYRNSGNTLLKYDIVWITFGQKPFYRSKCPSCFGRLPLEIVRWGTIGSNGSLAVAASLLHHFWPVIYFSNFLSLIFFLLSP